MVEDSLDIRPDMCCPDCDAKLPVMYTMKELRDMKNEAVMRMLKAEKVGKLSFAQYLDSIKHRKTLLKIVT